MALLKLKDLHSQLEYVDDFDDPKIELEQYITTPHIAGCMLHTIQSRYGDIQNKMVADVGCGTGMLSVGCCLLGAQVCFGFDIDCDALNICRHNVEEFEMSNIELVQLDVRKWAKTDDHHFIQKFDTVIMNPPFGTRQQGADSDFLIFALSIAKNSVYSLHKTTTIQHFARVAKSRNISLEVVAELKFALDKTYSFQRSQSKDISVALLRFSHVQCGLTATVGNLPAVTSVKTKQPKSKTASKR